MKKYFNKGLLYQWFNSAKAVIFLGLIAWAYMAYTMIGRYIDEMTWHISQNFDNYFSTFGLYNYFELGIIFVIIHLAGQGLSKRNNLMFLNSSPYTKKQIKYNEIISLLITGVLFIAVFIYMAVIRYFNYRNLLSIVDGYFQIISIEVLKIILFGMIGILFIMIIDSMFSNSIVGVVAMVSVIPLSICSIFAKIAMMINYIAVKDGKNVYALLYTPSEYENHRSFLEPFFNELAINKMRLSDIIINIIVLLIITGVLFLVYNKMNNLNSLEYSTKIFSSKTNEKIIRILCSLGAGCFAALFIVSRYIDRLQGINYKMYGALSGVNLMKGLSADIICVIIVSIISNIIIKKFLKIVE